MSEHGPADRPCGSCPYRLDVPSGVWAKEEYAKLPGFDGESHEQTNFGAFFCHQQDGRLCAGWVGCHDMEEMLGLRLALSHGLISDEDYDAALDYESPVPLFSSGAQAAAHGLRDLDAPSPSARRTIAVVTRKQKRKGGAT